MNYNKLKRSAEKITMPSDMEERIIGNIYKAAQESERSRIRDDKRPNISKTDYSQHVLGVEKYRPYRRNIRIISAMAACAVLVGTLGMSAHFLKNDSPSPQNASSYAADPTSHTQDDGFGSPISGAVPVFFDDFFMTNMKIADTVKSEVRVEFPDTISITDQGIAVENNHLSDLDENKQKSITKFFGDHEFTGWKSADIYDVVEKVSYDNAFLLAAFEGASHFYYTAVTETMIIFIEGSYQGTNDNAECYRSSCSYCCIEEDDFKKFKDMMAASGNFSPHLFSNLITIRKYVPSEGGGTDIISFADAMKNGSNIYAALGDHGKGFELGISDCELLDDAVRSISEKAEPCDANDVKFDGKGDITVQIENEDFDMTVTAIENMYLMYLYMDLKKSPDGSVRKECRRIYGITDTLESVIVNGTASNVKELMPPIDMNFLISHYGNAGVLLKSFKDNTELEDGIALLDLSRLLYGYEWEKNRLDASEVDNDSAVAVYQVTISHYDTNYELTFYENGYVRYRETGYSYDAGANVEKNNVWYRFETSHMIGNIMDLLNKKDSPPDEIDGEG